MVFAVLCVSDRCSKGICEDKSGPLIKELVSPLGDTREYLIVPDEKEEIEKALNEAIKADTAKRKERLEKELADLEKNQAARVRDLLDKVKSGEFKMPERRRMPPPVKERKK